VRAKADGAGEDGGTFVGEVDSQAAFFVG